MKIKNRERNAIIGSLAAGVVPSIGLHHIQVGRRDEVQAMIHDLNLVEEGSSTVRFIIGRFGSGKTFFLNLVRNVALQQKFVAVHADITTDRRLYGAGGQARSLFSELVKNLSTRSRPEGGALPNLIERWIGEIDYTIKSQGGTEEDVKVYLVKALHPLQDLVSGFDFASVLSRYYEGYFGQNDELRNSAVRWIRAEYSTKTEARQALGVRSIIDDATFYDYLKLVAAFVRIAGYAGLLVCIDELVVLSHRLANTTSRNKNYEAILRIINDCLQGRVEGLAFLFAGTDECLEDPRRGLFSYEALATRLAPNRFAVDGQQDYSSPVINLQNLKPEDCYVLLNNIRHVHAGGNPENYIIPDEAIVAYLEDCNRRMGAAYFQTPRDTVKDFVNFLNMLMQNSSRDWKTLLKINGRSNSGTSSEKSLPRPDSDDLTEFVL